MHIPLITGKIAVVGTIETKCILKDELCQNLGMFIYFLISLGSHKRSSNPAPSDPFLFQKLYKFLHSRGNKLISAVSVSVVYVNMCIVTHFRNEFRNWKYGGGGVVGSLHLRTIYSYGEVTITGEGLQMTYARHLWPLSSEGSLACHTYCDTSPFIVFISGNPLKICISYHGEYF